MQQQVQDLASPPVGVTGLEFARRVGVHRSTLHRIAVGDVEPSIATLRELAIAHGLELTITTVPLSDAIAAVAARALLDEAHPDGDDAAVGAWIERLLRQSPGGDPQSILLAAAAASTLLHRRGAAYLRGPADALRLASAGEASGGDWAVSGRAALELDRAAPLHGPSVLWVEDVERAAQLLGDTHTPAALPRSAHVIVAELNPSVSVDAFEYEHVRYVAPTQMLLDSIGLGGELAQTAEAISREWERA